MILRTTFPRTTSNQFESYGVTAKLSWDIGKFNLTSVSNYMHFDKLVFVDTDGAPAPQGIFGFAGRGGYFFTGTASQRRDGTNALGRKVFIICTSIMKILPGLALPINSPLLGLGNAPDGSVIPGALDTFPR